MGLDFLGFLRPIRGFSTGYGDSKEKNFPPTSWSRLIRFAAGANLFSVPASMLASCSCSVSCRTRGVTPGLRIAKTMSKFSSLTPLLVGRPEAQLGARRHPGATLRAVDLLQRQLPSLQRCQGAKPAGGGALARALDRAEGSENKARQEVEGVNLNLAVGEDNLVISSA
jgi:hypothetical protein